MTTAYRVGPHVFSLDDIEDLRRNRVRYPRGPRPGARQSHGRLSRGGGTEDFGDVREFLLSQASPALADRLQMAGEARLAGLAYWP